jgi:hypothetical protein
VPQAGTIAFADGGQPVTGCTAQAVDETTGVATCATSYPSTGTHDIVASYSGSPDTIYPAAQSLQA